MLAILVDGPSNSARVMSKALGVKRVRPHRVGAIRRPRTYINWGVAGQLPARYRVINRDVSVSNKIFAFAKLEVAGLSIPENTTDTLTAQEWANKGTVLARATATGSGGQGITVVRKGETVGRAAFYVKYIPKSAEYRLHVVNGKVIFTQQKRRRNGVEQDDDQRLIRNHANGYVFAENKITFKSPTIQEALEKLAVESVKVLGLDFAAVDLIVDKQGNNVYFLEVNTRPGLESTRLINSYAEAFRELTT
jgi:glutathione synthase/RimK-type ligase-like ATP-grasp enzyme